jgi:hypothetical protein
MGQLSNSRRRTEAPRACAEATRAKSTWQRIAAELEKAAAGADPADVSVALQMVVQLENVEYRIEMSAFAASHIRETGSLIVSLKRTN